MGARLVRLNDVPADPGRNSFGKLLREDGDRIRRDVFALLSPDKTDSATLAAGYTIVYPGCTTNGHAHADREEVYHFVRGRGVMLVDGSETEVEAGDTFYIGYGPFHTARNPHAAPLEYFWITIQKPS